ncbi:MAG: hypothetical protein HOP28_11405, partial [Gemmatimonadales bacterium]|nr:hypothetical protein [Gemmatimonadales bacterium]
MERTLRTIEELRALRPRSARRGLRRIVLALPDDSAALRKAERVINRGLSACGCEMGAVFLAVGMLVMALSAFGGPGPSFPQSLQGWLGVVGVLMGLALVGKVVG